MISNKETSKEKEKEKIKVSEINEIPTRDRPSSAATRKKTTVPKRDNEKEQTAF